MLARNYNMCDVGTAVGEQTGAEARGPFPSHLAVRILCSVLTTNFAGGPHGFNFSMGTAWAF